jgi:hypothetical protein
MVLNRSEPSSFCGTGQRFEELVSATNKIPS